MLHTWFDEFCNRLAGFFFAQTSRLKWWYASHFCPNRIQVAKAVPSADECEEDVYSAPESYVEYLHLGDLS